MPDVYVDFFGFTYTDGVCDHTSMTSEWVEMPFRDAKIGDEIKFPGWLGHAIYVKHSETEVREVANDCLDDTGRFSNGRVEEVGPNQIIIVVYNEYHKTDTVGYRLRFGDVIVGDIFREERITIANFQWQKTSDTSAYPTLETRDNEFRKPYTLFLKADDMVIQWRRRHGV